MVVSVKYIIIFGLSLQILLGNQSSIWCVKSSPNEVFHSLVRDIHSFKIMPNKRKIEQDSASKIRMRSRDVIQSTENNSPRIRDAFSKSI